MRLRYYDLVHDSAEKNYLIAQLDAFYWTCWPFKILQTFKLSVAISALQVHYVMRN